MRNIRQLVEILEFKYLSTLVDLESHPDDTDKENRELTPVKYKFGM